MSEEAKPLTPCCFCGKSEYAGRDPTYLTFGTRSEVTKTWWCHAACFEARLPDMPEPWSIYDYEADTGQPFN